MRLPFDPACPEALAAYLDTLAEPAFQRFSSALIPQMPAGFMRGVRLPKLRRIAAQIAKQNAQAYLDNARDGSFEEIMLQGMVIGCLDRPLDDILTLVKWFVPKIDNWSVCDSFCAGLKAARAHPDEVWDFLLPYLQDGREYFARFGVVMLLFYYVNETYLTRVLAALDRVRCTAFYARMAVAWAVSICFRAFPQRTLDYLNQCRLDDFTFNKAIQKMIESLKTDAETKALLRAMKRK